MLGSDVLDIAIGLAFLFFITSLVVTAAREVIEGFLQTRAIHLERGIRELLKDKDGTQLARQFYSHPAISALFRGDYNPIHQLKGRAPTVARTSAAPNPATTSSPTSLGKRNWWSAAKDPWPRLEYRSNLPAYIPARNFALALLDLSARGNVVDANGKPTPVNLDTLSFASVRAGVVQNIPFPDLQRLILQNMDMAKGDLEQARANLEGVFDSAMDRVSGWYRKETQKILLILGLLVAVLFNIDTIRIVRELYTNQAVREAIVAEAGSATQQVKDSGGTLTLKAVNCEGKTDRGISCAQERLGKLGYPIGWSASAEDSPVFGWSSVPGWLLTALALALGAPFWFDVLNKLMVIRSTVKPHEKSPEESSEDRR